MVEHLLDPASPLFREGRILVNGDPALTDRALYWGILAALAEGKVRRSDLAEEIGRTPTSLAFPTKVLTDGGWVDERPDPFHPNRTTLHLNDPIVRFHRLVIETKQRRLMRGDAARVARDARPLISHQIYGPHLEWMAAEWAMSFACERTMGGSPRFVSAGVFKRTADIRLTSRPWNADQMVATGSMRSAR